MWSVGSASPRSTNGAAIGRYSCILAEAERLRQSPLADAGRGDLLETIIDRVELRPNGLRMILSLVIPGSPTTMLTLLRRKCLRVKSAFGAIAAVRETIERRGLPRRTVTLGGHAAEAPLRGFPGHPTCEPQ